MESAVLRVDHVDGVARVIASGVLDASGVRRLRLLLRQATEAGWSLAVDLSAVSVIDAGAMRALADYQARVSARGGELHITGAEGLLLDELERFGLTNPLRAPAGDGEWEPPAREASHAIPNLAVGRLLAEAMRLPHGHPRRAQLRHQAIEVALPAAHRLARRYRNRGEAAEDLRQAAALGLIKAVDGYDASRGHEFSDYAVPTILGELRRHFRDRGWGVRVPRRLQEVWLDIKRAAPGLAQHLARSPTVTDLAEALGTSEELIIEALGAVDSYRPTSLSSPVGDGTAELADLIGGPDAGLEHVDDWQSVQPLLARLPARSQRVLAMRFWGNLTQSEIAAHLGVSQMQISRIISQALAALRRGLLDDT